MSYKISVVTVTKNAAIQLKSTINSVINQSYSNIEYIVIDGASVDKSINVIRENENWITYWSSEPDKGIYDAMNKGIEVASGDWIVFLLFKMMFLSASGGRPPSPANEHYYGEKDI